ncbi:MAG: TlpA disulfide reductase family protein, partial [Gemmatimonadota bacterium]
MKRSHSRLPYVAAGLGLALVVLLAWVNRDRFQPVVPGSAAPSFQVTDLSGAPVALSDFRGKVVLLNVWATWCPPCVYEMPSMQRLYDELADEDFEILAVSIDAPRGARDAGGRPGGNIEAFADSLGLTFPILHNPDGSIQRTYQTTGVPESFVIGKNGVIYRKVAGATEWDDPRYVELIRRL